GEGARARPRTSRHREQDDDARRHAARREPLTASIIRPTSPGRTLMDLRSLIAPRLVAHAHCDIPCGIYDPTPAKIAADTVAKMVEKIGQLDKNATDLGTRANFVRMVSVKEQHAEIVKKELQILWSDYFKPEHLEKFPKLHDSF